MSREIVRTKDGFFLRIEGDQIERINSSFAAWYEDVRLDPGLYPYYPVARHGGAPMNGEPAARYTATVPATITEAHYPPAFGGVLHYSETSRRNDAEKVGTRTNYHSSVDAYLMEYEYEHDKKGLMIRNADDTAYLRHHRPITEVE